LKQTAITKKMHQAALLWNYFVGRRFALLALILAFTLFGCIASLQSGLTVDDARNSLHYVYFNKFGRFLDIDLSLRDRLLGNISTRACTSTAERIALYDRPELFVHRSRRPLSAIH
jgi:hypothetical protein